jgi:diguanylate cyclase (GGDEF)-like protein
VGALIRPAFYHRELLSLQAGGCSDKLWSTLPFSVAILSARTLDLPPAYAQAGAVVTHATATAQLLPTLMAGTVRLCLIDLTTEGVAASVPAILQAATSQDPPPFVALFGETSAPPLADGALPWEHYAIGPTQRALERALHAAMPYLALADRALRLQEQVTQLQGQLAEHAEINGERSSKMARLEKRVFDFFTLSQVGKALASIQGLTELSKVFLAMVREVYDSRNCALLLYDEVRQAFVVQDALGIEPEVAAQVSFSLREGLFWQLLNAGEPFPIVDSQGNYRFEQQIRRARLELLDSWLWVPLKLKNTLIGILTVGPKSTGQPYAGEERSYIAQLANQATVAFEFARMNIQKELTAKELAKKMENLSILYSVSKAMNFMNDLKRVLLLILEKAVDAVGAQKASLMLIDDESGELVVKVVKGVPADVETKINTGEMQCARIRLGEGIAGRVAATKKPILVDDIRNSEFSEPGRSYVENILCVPLTASDECIGVINITNKKSGEKFNQDDADILATLASQAAVTIHNARLYYLAITDGLTQLHIHRYFQQRLKEETARAKRFERPLALVMIDIDHFKHFNDTWGHPQGDLVLMSVARAVRNAVREVDIAARYGGEEFAVICPETTAEEAMILAERLRKRVEELVITGPSGPMKVTISLGVAALPAHASAPETLVQEADRALYKAKEAGRNRAVAATTSEAKRAAG